MAGITYKKLSQAQTIGDTDIVKVTQMGHIVEIKHNAKEPDILQQFVKLDKENYAIIDRNTGEIVETRQYNLNENRSQNTAGLKHTMKSIRDLINNNITGAPNELFLTLTYQFADGSPMNDIRKASKDFDIFVKRFRRKHPDLEYIAVLEPQANTAWHWHMLVIFTSWTSKEHIRMDNNTVIEPLWGHGYTKTKAISHVDNIGAYLSAYLSNVEINDENKDLVFDTVYKGGHEITIEEKQVTGEDGNKTTKKYIKGGRMHLYPSGANIYRYSRGIKKPAMHKMIYCEAKGIVGEKPPDFSKTVLIEGSKWGEEKRVYNTVTYEHYNLRRKNQPPNCNKAETDQ